VCIGHSIKIVEKVLFDIRHGCSYPEKVFFLLENSCGACLALCNIFQRSLLEVKSTVLAELARKKQHLSAALVSKVIE
jgi:hypothetical protein